MKIGKESGWSRPWGEGEALANKNFMVDEGMAWRLVTDEAWFDK